MLYGDINADGAMEHVNAVINPGEGKRERGRGRDRVRDRERDRGWKEEREGEM